MLGTGAKYVEANIATAVTPPWAGWACGTPEEACFPVTQGRRSEASGGANEQWARLSLAGRLFKTLHRLHTKAVNWIMSAFCL